MKEKKTCFPDPSESEMKATSSGQVDAQEEDPGLLVRAEAFQGSRLGDTYVRFVYPSHHLFRRLGTGVLAATEAAEMPRTGLERVATKIKRVLIGTPLVTARAESERLTKFKALAVLSSDAISSVAYATEAILMTLMAAGSSALGLTLLISFAIVVLLGVVALSYRQTIPAYPNGGGSYIVAKENLGLLPGLTAAAALMIDYILTVAVSVSAGVQALVTLFPSLAAEVVLIDVVCVCVITLVNLRGIRESGSIFAIPTYVFIGSALLLIFIGCFKAFLFQHQPLLGAFPLVQPVETLSLFLILRSFAAGCAAMTGVEAISNGIPAFQPPETRNAALTLTWMAVILGTLFLGITVLALSYGIEPNPIGNPTVLGQIAQQVFTGPLFFLYPVFQLATLFILTLAANTSYSDFPRLASLLARDHFLPHQFTFRGDRLAFSTGIVFLAILASVLLITFHGNTTALINLYAVGVFLSFTLSQTGMVRHWWHLRRATPGARRSLVINGLGALTTLVVATVIATTKFIEGAWVVVLLLPLLILLFLAIRRHYLCVACERRAAPPHNSEKIRHRLIVPVVALNTATQWALTYARSISPQVVAVHVNLNPKTTASLCACWEQWQASRSEGEQMQLQVIEPIHRSLLCSLLHYFLSARRKSPDETLTVILPEAVKSRGLWQWLDHPWLLLLKIALFFQAEIVATSVKWEEQKSAPSFYSQEMHHCILVPIAELDWVSLHSLMYARSISSHVTAIHIAMDLHDIEVIRAQWERTQQQMTDTKDVRLVVIESPYRSLLHPLLAYIEVVQELHPDAIFTVMLPEFVVDHWWEHFLHNQTALQIKIALLALPNMVVTDIPQRL